MAISIDVQKAIQAAHPFDVRLTNDSTTVATVTVTMKVDSEAREFVLRSGTHATPKGAQAVVKVSSVKSCSIEDWGSAPTNARVIVKAATPEEKSDAGTVV